VSASEAGQRPISGLSAPPGTDPAFRFGDLRDQTPGSQEVSPMFRRASTFAGLLLLLTASVPHEARAQFSFKFGAQFRSDDTSLDTSKHNWILGQTTDMWLGSVVGLSYETDFSYDKQTIGGQPQELFSVFNYVNLKLRAPTKGIKPYVGGGIGYSPMFLSFGGDTRNVGGVSGQILGGVMLADHFFVEGQYKITDLQDSSSQKLFTLFGGVSF
jgi:opacity protein-like surface antigen